MATSDVVLVVGEIVVDYTLPRNGEECKLRLGGVVHAARGLWAAGQAYAVAVYCPQYLAADAEKFLLAHGCTQFILLGDIVGAPNVILIGDETEVSHQGYEDLLRVDKRAVPVTPPPDISQYQNIVVFPGKFEVQSLLGISSPQARFTFDIAYDVEDLSVLAPFRGRTKAVVISTSSPLFNKLGKDDVNPLIEAVAALSPEVFLLKENRGGSRLFDLTNGNVEHIPATLSETVNSVGVGDVYTAVMVSFATCGWIAAAWRGCQVATAYSHTTYPDDFRSIVQGELQLSLDELRGLGGTILPWHARQNFSIYLAGPDFSYVDRTELVRAIESLKYHNFKVRRPIEENGELTLPANQANILRTYHKDYELLKECDLVFAVPLYRDPGTLVEIGMALALGKPVMTFDPHSENNNTMVMGGSVVYSPSLGDCLNGTFDSLAKLPRRWR